VGGGDNRGMRIVGVALLLVMACTDRKGADTEAEGTETGDTSDTGGPTTPTTGELENPSGFCSPAAEAPGACPADYQCCSDDPATTQGRLPNYFSGKVDDKYGVPIFSGANNVLSYSGQCVDNGGNPSPLTNGCPVPCNPTWSEAQKAEICGVGSACCSFQTVDPVKDCELDPNTGRWRSARGSDIPNLSTWGDQHTTNQDPQGASCLIFATGGGGILDMEALKDCYMQLTVADQRGFCYVGCDCTEDLCDMKNPDWKPRCG
jgi:hypothetical protein